MLLMETVICDSELSQLSGFITSAHSANAQPFQKRKSPPISWRKKKAKGRKTVQVPFLMAHRTLRKHRFSF
jgi:hypothetical protein